MYGVIFLFKYPTGEAPSETPNDGTFDFDAAQSMFFASQTIQNACGTQALLSVLLNQEEDIVIGPKLQEFKEFTFAFPSDVWLKTHGRESAASILIRLRSYEGRPFRIRNSSAMFTTHLLVHHLS